LILLQKQEEDGVLAIKKKETPKEAPKEAPKESSKEAPKKDATKKEAPKESSKEAPKKDATKENVAPVVEQPKDKEEKKVPLDQIFKVQAPVRPGKSRQSGGGQNNRNNKKPKTSPNIKDSNAFPSLTVTK